MMASASMQFGPDWWLSFFFFFLFPFFFSLFLLFGGDSSILNDVSGMHWCLFVRIKKLASGDRPQSRESNHSNPTSANASGPSSASTFDAVHLNGPSLGQQQQPQHGGRPLSYSSVAGNGQGRPRSAAQQQHQQASSGGQGSGSGGAGNGDALVASADQNPFRYDFDLMLSLFKDVNFSFLFSW